MEFPYCSLTSSRTNFLCVFSHARVRSSLLRGVVGSGSEANNGGDRCQPGSRRQPSPRCSFVCATNLLLLGSLEIKRRARLRRRRGERQKSDSGICVYSALAHIESLVSSLGSFGGGIQKSLDERASLSRSHLSARFIYISARCVQTGSGGLSGSPHLSTFEAHSRAHSYIYVVGQRAAITHIYTKHLPAPA